MRTFCLSDFYQRQPLLHQVGMMRNRQRFKKRGQIRDVFWHVALVKNIKCERVREIGFWTTANHIPILILDVNHFENMIKLTKSMFYKHFSRASVAVHICYARPYTIEICCPRGHSCENNDNKKVETKKSLPDGVNDSDYLCSSWVH